MTGIPGEGWKVFADGDDSENVPLWRALAQFTSDDLDEGLKANAAVINTAKPPFARYYNVAFVVSMAFGFLFVVSLIGLLFSATAKPANLFSSLTLATLERVERLEPVAGDILYSREGGILGLACRVPPGIRLCLGQRLMLIRAGAETRPDFLEMVLNSPFITSIAKACTTGGAAPRVNMSTVRAYPIPLPPLAEQHRIVTKVDELIALCDQLEASLTTGEQTRSRLLESVLHIALEPV